MTINDVENFSYQIRQKPDETEVLIHQVEMTIDGKFFDFPGGIILQEETLKMYQAGDVEGAILSVLQAVIKIYNQQQSQVREQETPRERVDRPVSLNDLKAREDVISTRKSELEALIQTGQDATSELRKLQAQGVI